MKAIWNGKVIADSENTIIIENNHYFPPQSIRKEFLSSTETQTLCPWKGTASYYTVEVDGKINKDAAWYYQDPFDKAIEIKNYVAFWKGVDIVK